MTTKTWLQELQQQLKPSIEARNDDALLAPTAPSLESDDGDAAGDCDSEAAINDADDAGDQVAAVEEETSELEKATGALESILQAMEARADVGLTAAEAGFANIAIESAIGNWGLGNVIPSTESFGGEESRIVATGKGIENIRETIDKAVAYIKELFKKAASLIREWYEKIFDVVTKLGNRAARLKERAGKIDGAASERSIPGGARLAAFSVDGKVPSAGDLFRRLDKLFDCAAQTDAFAAKVEQRAGAALADLLGSSEEKFEGVYEGIVRNHEKNEPPAFFHKSGDFYVTDTFPGEVKYKADPSGPSLKFSVVKKGGERVDGKFGLLNKESILEAADDAAKFSAKAKSTRAALKTANKGEESDVLKGLRKESKLGMGQGRKANGLATKLASDAVSARKIVVQMLMDGARAASAYLRLAEECASKYKGAEKSPRAKELGHGE